MSRPISETGTSTSHPVSYDSGYSAYSVSGLDNALTDSDSTTYATINLTRNQNAETIIFYNFSLDIPSGATINSVTCSAKCYISTTNSGRVSSRQIRLYSGSTAMGDASTVSNSTTEFDMSCGTWTAAQLANAKIRLYAKRGSSNTTTNYYFRFYGATLTVTYTISTTAYTITASSNASGVTIEPASQEVYAGNSGEVALNTNQNIIVTDNNTDVTSQLQYVTPSGGSDTFTGVPSSYDDANSTYDSIYSGSTSSGLTGHTDTNRICVYANTAAHSVSKLTYNFDCSSIPSNATITSVSCVAAAACYSSGQYFDVKTLQLYSGNTAKGTATTITGNGSTRTDHNISGGSWTRAELDNAKIVLYIERGNNTTQASFSFWGATLTIAYTTPSTPYYSYTITNISADHTILVVSAATDDKIFRKVNGTWVQASKVFVRTNRSWSEVRKVYKKINGSWVEQNDISAMFNPNAVYING